MKYKDKLQTQIFLIVMELIIFKQKLLEMEFVLENLNLELYKDMYFFN